MNNTFNLQRFIWLFKKHSKENYKLHLLEALLLIGFLVVYITYCASFEDLGVRTQEHIFWSFFSTGGGLFCSFTSFIDLREKNKAISTLMLPVSSFERFLVNWIYSFLIFQLVFIVCFYAVDMAVLSVINRNSMFVTPMMDLTSTHVPVCYTFLAFGFFHAVFFLGAATFSQFAAVVMAPLSLACFLIVLVLFNLGLAHLLIGGDVMMAVPLTQISIREGLSDYVLQDLELGPILVISMVLICTFLLWAAAYFKIKEKQV